MRDSNSRGWFVRWLGSVAVLMSGLATGLRAEPMDATSLRRAGQYSAEMRGTALLIARQGRVIFEEYTNGASRSAGSKIYSGTKGFWALAALAAQQDGILDLDDKVSATLPEWAARSDKAGVTLRQLLNFSSALAATNGLHDNGWKDRDEHAMKQSLVASPSAAFVYGPAGLQVFHEVLKRKLAPRKETPTRFLERRVLRPMGLGKQRYLPDAAGNPLLATGFIMSARDWWRMGKVIQKQGSPVVSGMAEAFDGSSANPMFGLGFWTNRLAARPGSREVDPEELLDLTWSQQQWRQTCLCHAAPPDLVASIGSGGQRLYVVPSLELVIVRQGGISKYSDGRFLRLIFSKD